MSTMRSFFLTLVLILAVYPRVRGNEPDATTKGVLIKSEWGALELSVMRIPGVKIEGERLGFATDSLVVNDRLGGASGARASLL